MATRQENQLSFWLTAATILFMTQREMTAHKILALASLMTNLISQWDIIGITIQLCISRITHDDIHADTHNKSNLRGAKDLPSHLFGSFFPFFRLHNSPTLVATLLSEFSITVDKFLVDAVATTRLCDIISATFAFDTLSWLTQIVMLTIVNTRSHKLIDLYIVLDLDVNSFGFSFKRSSNFLFSVGFC